MITIDLRNKILEAIDDALIHQIKHHYEAAYVQKTGNYSMEREEIQDHFIKGLQMMFDVYEVAKQETKNFLDHYKK